MFSSISRFLMDPVRFGIFAIWIRAQEKCPIRIRTKEPGSETLVETISITLFFFFFSSLSSLVPTLFSSYRAMFELSGEIFVKAGAEVCCKGSATSSGRTNKFFFFFSQK